VNEAGMSSFSPFPPGEKGLLDDGRHHVESMLMR